MTSEVAVRRGLGWSMPVELRMKHLADSRLVVPNKECSSPPLPASVLEAS